MRGARDHLLLHITAEGVEVRSSEARNRRMQPVDSGDAAFDCRDLLHRT